MLYSDILLFLLVISVLHNIKYIFLYSYNEPTVFHEIGNKFVNDKRMNFIKPLIQIMFPSKPREFVVQSGKKKIPLYFSECSNRFPKSTS